MTREEAINCLYVHSSTNGSGLCTDKQHYEAKQMAIKALDQESCEDAISRQAAIDAIKEIHPIDTEYDSTLYDKIDIMYVLKDLPPVNLQPKTGHCKDCKWWKDSDGLYRRGSHAESQCPINRREVMEGNGYCYMFEP